MTTERVPGAPGDADHIMLDAGLGESVQGAKAKPRTYEPYVECSPVGNLETCPDELNDAAHARLDEAILRRADDEPSTLFRAVYLLSTIVSTSEGQLDLQYENALKAKALISEHPKLIDMLKEAWEARAFKGIRNLSAISTFQSR
jgi:hypothetical protein